MGRLFQCFRFFPCFFAKLGSGILVLVSGDKSLSGDTPSSSFCRLELFNLPTFGAENLLIPVMPLIPDARVVAETPDRMLEVSSSMCGFYLDNLGNLTLSSYTSFLYVDSLRCLLIFFPWF